MRIFGHRGARGHAPENTLPSIELALDQGADWIEVDVQMADGECWVIHDKTLDRTTNGSGSVADATRKTLASLDAGNGAAVPTLAQVMACVAGRAGLNIELKGAGTAGFVAAAIANRVQAGDADWNDFIVSSFHHGWLQAVRTLEPKIPVGALYLGVPVDLAASAEALGAVAVHLGLDFLDPAMIDDAHTRGLAAYVYTVNAEPELQRMVQLGVDGVFTDFPDRARRLFPAAD